uniref:Putative endonuclease n=1 Tax=viral metagenome TaxID=1070528 RepID=A0A6M3L9B8_9ZZZZ
MKKLTTHYHNLDPDEWVVYLLECSDGTYYCGITNNICDRLEDHNFEGGSKYTRGRRPVDLIAISPKMSKSFALKIEHIVKQEQKRHKLLVFTKLWSMYMENSYQIEGKINHEWRIGGKLYSLDIKLL